MIATARATVAGRLWVYLREMFPPEIYLPFSFAGFFGFYFLAQALAGGDGPLTVTWRAIAGGLTLTAFSLLMRVFDELKDQEADRTLFPERPLPSGRVRLADLQGLGLTLILGMLALNLALGPVALTGFLAMLLYGLGTFVWFFAEGPHRRSLLLTVATHNPVVIFCNLYVWSIWSADAGLGLTPPGPAAWAGLVMYWMPVLAWEFSRKIKAPAAENDYVTYSRLLGPRRAALVPMAAITLSAGLAAWFGLTLGLPRGALALGAVAYAVAAFGFGRFLARVTPANARLRPFAEAFSLGLYLALLGGLIARHGVTWAA